MKSEIKEVVNNIIYKTIVGVLIFGFLNFLFLYFFGDCPNIKETWSNIVAFSSAAATLSAALIAAYLFNDWKEEKFYDIKSQYLTKILQSLNTVHLELVRLRSIAYNIKKTEELMVVYEKYLFRKTPKLYDFILDTYPDIQIYCKLSKNEKLKQMYNNIDGRLHGLDLLNVELFTTYNNYLKKVKEIYDSKKDIDEEDITLDFSIKYTEDFKKLILGVIRALECFFRQERYLETNNPSINTDPIKYMPALETAIEDIKSMISFCTEELDII